MWVIIDCRKTMKVQIPYSLSKLFFLCFTMTSCFVWMGTDIPVTAPIFSLPIEEKISSKASWNTFSWVNIEYDVRYGSGTCIKIWTNTMTLMDEQRAKKYPSIVRWGLPVEIVGVREKIRKKRRDRKKKGRMERGKKEGCFQFALSNITLNCIYWIMFLI